MSKFMMIYKGKATDMADMTEEQAAGVMAKWATWMQKVGPALVDLGTPFGPGASVVDDGSAGTALSLNGYSIVEAASLDAAVALDVPVIGQELRQRGVQAFVFAMAGILIYIGIRFRFSFGLGAIVAVAHDILITVALLTFLGYELSLNVVAAMLTITGYSVNDSIVVFDKKKRHLPKSQLR